MEYSESGWIKRQLSFLTNVLQKIPDQQKWNNGSMQSVENGHEVIFEILENLSNENTFHDMMTKISDKAKLNNSFEVEMNLLTYWDDLIDHNKNDKCTSHDILEVRDYWKFVVAPIIEKGIFIYKCYILFIVRNF